jgi:hypothetical protein
VCVLIVCVCERESVCVLYIQFAPKMVGSSERYDNLRVHVNSNQIHSNFLVRIFLLKHLFYILVRT